MQNNYLKLKEIIWEITGQCKNGCSYCGSKKVTNQPNPSEKTLKHIIDEIVKYPPEQIDISGGDPLLISFSIHEYLTNELKAKSVSVKMLQLHLMS